MQAKLQRMSAIDRRSGLDRRSVPRFSVRIDVEWETKRGRRIGSLSDLSIAGGFVLCSGEVEDGEAVRLFFPLGEGMKVEFSGTVVNHVYEIGFAMRFRDLGAAQYNFLLKFIETLGN